MGVAVGVTAVMTVLISMKIQKQIPVKVVGERDGGGGSRGGHLPFAHSFTHSALPTSLTHSIALHSLVRQTLRKKIDDFSGVSTLKIANVVMVGKRVH